MKKLNILSALLTLTIFSTNINIHHVNAANEVMVDDSYYQGLSSSLTGDAFLNELTSLVTSNRGKGNVVKYSYKDVWEKLKITDEDPSNPNNVICIYSGISIPKANQDGQVTSGIRWNREHVWPKSHGFGHSDLEDANNIVGAYTDLHHLRPSEQSINAFKNNNDVGEAQYKQDYKDFGLTHDFGSDNFLANNVFEPRDEVKGDIARMLFYMEARYNDPSILDLDIKDYATNATEYTKYDKSATSHYGEIGVLSDLIKWHIQDPVSEEERIRNNKVYDIQHNRNPFIDHPEFVERVYENEYLQASLKATEVDYIPNPSETITSYKATFNDNKFSNDIFTASNVNVGAYGNGVRISSTSSATLTSKLSYENVYQIDIDYHSNASTGSTKYHVSCGNFSQDYYTTVYGGTSSRKISVNLSQPSSGNVNIDITGIANSTYIEGITIYTTDNVHDSSIRKHLVTFNTHGGNNIDMVQYSEGEIVQRPEDPVKDGYTFLGWYLDDTYTNEYHFNQAIYESIELHARYEAFINEPSCNIGFSYIKKNDSYPTTIVENEQYLLEATYNDTQVYYGDSAPITFTKVDNIYYKINVNNKCLKADSNNTTKVDEIDFVNNDDLFLWSIEFDENGYAVIRNKANINLCATDSTENPRQLLYYRTDKSSYFRNYASSNVGKSNYSQVKLKLTTENIKYYGFNDFNLKMKYSIKTDRVTNGDSYGVLITPIKQLEQYQGSFFNAFYAVNKDLNSLIENTKAQNISNGVLQDKTSSYEYNAELRNIPMTFLKEQFSFVFYVKSNNEVKLSLQRNISIYEILEMYLNPENDYNLSSNDLNMLTSLKVELDK